MMKLVYAIVVFNFFHQQQGIDPMRFPDLPSCQVELAQRHFSFSYWGQCQPFQVLPQQRYLRRYLHSRG